MKYLVTAEVVISMHTVVEAKNEKEAREEAESRALMGLCHQCSSADGDHEEWVSSGEFDGEPKIVSVEKR